MSTVSPDQIAANWDPIVAHYESAFEGFSTQFAAEALRLLSLKPGERVIDVAAGTGAFSLLAAQAGAEVLATDFAPRMIARLRERIAAARLSGISAEVMDGQALTVPDASFDASASVLGLIFFPDIPKGLAELRRVLREGGRTAIVCWNDPATLPLMTLLVKSIKQVLPDFLPPAAPPVWARLGGADMLGDQMRKAGFRKVEVAKAIGFLRIESPEEYWANFTSSAPPLKFLFERLGSEVTAAVGRDIQTLRTGSQDGVPTLTAEVCIGIGRA